MSGFNAWIWLIFAGCTVTVTLDEGGGKGPETPEAWTTGDDPMVDATDITGPVESDTDSDADSDADGDADGDSDSGCDTGCMP